jgi:hypothetical protein
MLDCLGVLGPKKVTSVLLPDGQWHSVVTGTFFANEHSFFFDEEPALTLAPNRPWPTSGPLSSVLSIRFEREPQMTSDESGADAAGYRTPTSLAPEDSQSLALLRK